MTETSGARRCSCPKVQLTSNYTKRGSIDIRLPGSAQGFQVPSHLPIEGAPIGKAFDALLAVVQATNLLQKLVLIDDGGHTARRCQSK